MSNQFENKICQNCQKDFTIESDDFDFYKKIDVPPPTWCPDCRSVRRMAWRNERNLYSRKCDLCGKSIISMYSQSFLAPIYCNECWHGDSWDASKIVGSLNDDIPLFKQWSDLLKIVPHLSLWKIRENVNSEFINYAADNKNCYLSYSTVSCENTMYSYSVDKDKDCLDDTYLKSSQLCYENIDGTNNYFCTFCLRSRDCMNSLFLFNCVNCQDCFMSSNLRNKRHVFRGQQLSKEEYETNLEKAELGSTNSLILLNGEFKIMTELKSLHKYANILKSENSTGDNIENCKNVRDSFEGYNAENSRYGVRLGNTKDCQDFYGCMFGELNYEVVAPGFQSYKNLFSYLNDSSRELFYSVMCKNSSHLFACIGLRNKQYCILNKQYAKEEYEALVPKIIKHMNDMPYIDSKGRVYRYGEFFPPELSPFAYNETIAQEYFPLTKDQAISQEYRWKDPDTKEYTITKSSKNLSDHIKDVTDDIFKEIIGCAHEGKCTHQCTTAFRIIPEELSFYRRMNIPLPRLCPNCRHYERLSQRNPLKLWHRQCMCDKPNHNHKGHCPNEFETSYAPDRKETVYCEQCYNAEVV